VTATIVGEIDVAARLRELGLPAIPSEPVIAILPRGLDSARRPEELRHETDASTLRKLLAEQEIRVQQVECASGSTPVVVRRSADWIAPTLFVSALLVTQNPYAIQLALGVVESFVSERLRGSRSGQNVRLEVVVERSKSTMSKKIVYEGPAVGISELCQLIAEISDE
jgi:hypothetical protein